MPSGARFIMEQNMENRLWDYIDGSSHAAERAFVEQLIARQEAWRKKYHELLEINQLMAGSVELDEPSMRFSQNVMEAISLHQVAPAAKTYINKKIIYGIGLFFVVMIAGMVVYGLAQVNWSDSSASGNLLSRYDVSKINVGKFFNNTFTTIFMMVNVIIGLMLLDMWLGNKRKTLHQKNA